MNGDWIAQDAEPDYCCPDINIGCTCDLEQSHQKQIRVNGFIGYNVGWSLDEIEGVMSSKVGFPGDSRTWILTTTQTSNREFDGSTKKTFLHRVEQY